MNKKRLKVLMLLLLIMQTLSPTANVFAETSNENDSTATPTTTDTTNDTSDTNKDNSQAKEESEISSSETKDSAKEIAPKVDTSVGQEPIVTPTAAVTITDELLSNMTVTDMNGTEYSQQSVNRVLNSSPVTANLDFVVANKDYAAGSTYTMDLPDNLGYSDVDGDINGVNAKWAVDATNKKLSIVFNQRVTDTQFTLSLKSYLHTDKNPLLTVQTPGVTKNQYAFDLYEDIDAISYQQTAFNFGIQGDISYNLNRTLSGNQTLELLTTEVQGAVFSKEDSSMVLNSYDVDVTGAILPETKQELVLGSDYSVAESSFARTALTVTNMNQQKAYILSLRRSFALESVTEYDYQFTSQYPTTKVGGVNLKKPTVEGLEFTAKTSKDQKVIAKKSLPMLHNASFQSKGNYYINIYDTFTSIKTGQEIVLESKNGQELTDISFSISTQDKTNLNVTDYFDVENKNGKLVLTATKDSVLRVSINKLTVPFDKKNIDLALKTPLVSGREFLLISDAYVEPISILNPLNAETAWGNYDRNGAYVNRTTVNVEGTASNPIENLTVKVNHPAYLTLRASQDINYKYKIDKDYTISEISGQSVINFKTPITETVNIPLGFNYVPDSLAQNKSIPVDTIPVTMSADGIAEIATSVTTGSKQGSEKTLQGSKNQFLVNARNDSFSKSLIVNAQAPIGTEMIFSIYDVSNNKVDSIYPQYWDRGQYFDNPIDPTSDAYPDITFDEAKNSYKFDFGKTSNRYIIEYKYANGWIDVPPIYVTGSAEEPLYSNQVMSSLVSVSNTVVDILSTTQANHPTIKNVTQNTLTTQNIDGQTRKVKNPIFTITPKGDTNAQVDTNSITIDNVPAENYTVEKTATGAVIRFKDYTLTENITIRYNTISANAGRIYTENTIDSETLTQMNVAKKTVNSVSSILQFSAGDADGVVHLAKATFYAYQADDKTIPISDVQFELVDNVMNTTNAFATDATGEYYFDAIMSGEYTLRVTQVPAGYEVDPSYLTGKVIKLSKDDNRIEVPLTKLADQTSVTAFDSTIYVGDTWQPVDNFSSATDNAGANVEFDKITTTGDVNTNKVGHYEVVYHNGAKEAKAIINVIADQFSLEVKDSTIYVGDSWEAKDNFVSATDRNGNAIDFNNVKFEGTVDTKTKGDYEISYTVEIPQPEIQSMLKVAGQPKNQTITKVAKVTVLEKTPAKPTPEEPGSGKEPIDKGKEPGQKQPDAKQPTTKSKQSPVSKAAKTNQEYPKTGETTKDYVIFAGMLLVMMSLYWIKRMRRNSFDA